MKKSALVRSHVERCLQEIWQQPSIVRDGDGDYAFRSDTAKCWVRIDRLARPRTVTVFAFAALQIPTTVKVLREINELSINARTAKIFLCRDILVVQQALLLDAVSVRSLRHTIGSVSSVADTVGPMFAALHDGHTPFVSAEVDHAC